MVNECLAESREWRAILNFGEKSNFIHIIPCLSSSLSRPLVCSIAYYFMDLSDSEKSNLDGSINLKICSFISPTILFSLVCSFPPPILDEYPTSHSKNVRYACLSCFSESFSILLPFLTPTDPLAILSVQSTSFYLYFLWILKTRTGNAANLSHFGKIGEIASKTHT